MQIKGSTGILKRELDTGPGKYIRNIMGSMIAIIIFQRRCRNSITSLVINSGYTMKNSVDIGLSNTSNTLCIDNRA